MLAIGNQQFSIHLDGEIRSSALNSTIETWFPLIAITMGDPAGIGAEIAVKAIANPIIYSICRPFIIGDAKIISDAIRFTGVNLRQINLSEPSEVVSEAGIVNVLDLKNVDLNELIYGKVHPSAGRAAFEYIRTAIELAVAGRADAVVTGPIHKEALNLGGYHYSGHTEIFADLTGTKEYAMMLVAPGMRVVHVTTHVALRKVCELVKKDRLSFVIKITNSGLKALGITAPRLGVAGLNPHAGEGGLFGTEEVEEITPAILDARVRGINVEGPIPSDTLFAKVLGGQYDVAIAMYHDQGHIPLKTVNFTLDGKTGRWTAMSGVNVTLGLPIIRTSVDHGVAFDKAGIGTANPQSLLDAIKLAVAMAVTKRSNC